MKHRRPQTRNLSQLLAVVSLVFALLLPSVAPAVAHSLLSQEQLLAQDLARSLCAETSENGDGQGTGHSGKDCDLCVLCRTLAVAMVPDDVSGEPQGGLDQRPHAVASAQWITPDYHPLDAESGPPRAPPANS